MNIIHKHGAQAVYDAASRHMAETLEEFQAFELARGVPVHDLAQRMIRLAREAGDWLARNP